MTNLEANKERIREATPLCMIAHLCRYGYTCANRSKTCDCCVFEKNVDECIKEILAEHKEPIKLTKFEYDLLMSYINKGYSFKNYSELKEMRNKGYFEGVTDTSMTINEILDNCEVIENE